jgi:hypothetical protein
MIGRLITDEAPSEGMLAQLRASGMQISLVGEQVLQTEAGMVS